jgi:antitoxin (DNA-binding transcriptional repressor) of toxin-antitoxin stability system
MAETLSVTEAVRNFSDVINRVYYQGQTFLLSRGGTVVAQITPPEKVVTGADMLRIWPTWSRLDPEDAEQWAKELEELRTQAGPPTERKWDS